MKSQRLHQDPSLPRRRLLRIITLGALGSMTLAAQGRLGTPAARFTVAQAGPRERPLREADFYRPHDLAG